MKRLLLVLAVLAVVSGCAQLRAWLEDGGAAKTGTGIQAVGAAVSTFNPPIGAIIGIAGLAVSAVGRAFMADKPLLWKTAAGVALAGFGGEAVVRSAATDPPAIVAPAEGEPATVTGTATTSE